MAELPLGTGLLLAVDRFGEVFRFRFRDRDHQQGRVQADAIGDFRASIARVETLDTEEARELARERTAWIETLSGHQPLRRRDPGPAS